MSTADSNVIDPLEAAFFAGDKAALKDAYDEYGSLVYTFCHRLVGTAQAEDLTKEVFVGAWRDRAQFDSGVISLAGWLMGIATSRIADNTRRHGHSSEGKEVSAEAIRIGDRMLLANALQGLPKRTRLAVELALSEGLTHREIADRARLPLETVERDIRQGAERIRRDLSWSR